MPFPLLFSPLKIRETEIRNRVLSTGHQTWLARDGRPSEDLAAYHEARARGGAGLIVVESSRFHSSSFTDSPEIRTDSDDCIPGYRAIADAVHRHGGRVFGQLSHSGRCTQRLMGGRRGVVYAPSPVPDNRFHTMPREMPADMIDDIIESAGAAAKRFAEAGLDGIELLVSHGLLFAQFLNPQVNKRRDRFGGDFDNRMRALRMALSAMRRGAGDDLVIGIRISAGEIEPGGLSEEDALRVAAALGGEKLIDYVNTTVGSMAGLGGSIHVVPPMSIEHGYVAPHSARLREATGLPVFVAGRINQPQIAERILAEAQADMCGMTRAMIADEEMANKARDGRVDEIRACIGCNQACIGHFHMGCSISCIQHPVSGRERTLGSIGTAGAPKTVFVGGGGPAGMKAACVATERGHRVTLFEAERRLGGQALLAQMLPGRDEFGGLVTNLEAELDRLNVDVRRNTRLTKADVEGGNAEAVIIATGATPYLPPVEGAEEAHVVDAWALLQAHANPGSRVLIADWRCDWVGMGIAEKLALDGHHVRLAVNGLHAGQELQPYLRDHWAGKLHRLGVEIIPYANLFGADADSAYLQHSITGDAIICEDVDTVVLAQGHAPETALEQELNGLDGIELHLAGDCLSPRSAEEAVYEGMMAALAI